MTISRRSCRALIFAQYDRNINQKINHIFRKSKRSFNHMYKNSLHLYVPLILVNLCRIRFGDIHEYF